MTTKTTHFHTHTTTHTWAMYLIIGTLLGFFTAKAFANKPVTTCQWPNTCVQADA